MTDQEWNEFYKYCKKHWPMWAPDKTSILLFLEWQKSKKFKV